MSVVLDLAPQKETGPIQKATLSALIESLLAQGAIPFVPHGRPDPAPRPIPVRGEPVSETIIADRH